MNPTLDSILAILTAVKEEKDLVARIYEFMEDEILPEWERRSNEINLPEPFEKVVHEIAEFIEMGHRVYLNMDTQELEDMPENLDSYMSMREYANMVGGIKHKKWKNVLEIEPLESHQSFKIMARFAEQLPDKKASNDMLGILDRKKPFANFNHYIHHSDYRDDWFKFRIEYHENWVRELISWELKKIS